MAKGDNDCDNNNSHSEKSVDPDNVSMRCCVNSRVSFWKKTNARMNSFHSVDFNFFIINVYIILKISNGYNSKGTKISINFVN